jgi:hypothetical protein
MSEYMYSSKHGEQGACLYAHQKYGLLSNQHTFCLANMGAIANNYNQKYADYFGTWKPWPALAQAPDGA